MVDAKVLRYPNLEGAHLRTQDELATSKHPLDGVVDIVPQLLDLRT